MNKSAIFDGLEEDEEELANIFVPRSSVKKLVLKPKIPPTIVSAGKKIHTSYSQKKDRLAQNTKIGTAKRHLLELSWPI